MHTKKIRQLSRRGISILFAIALLLLAPTWLLAQKNVPAQQTDEVKWQLDATVDGVQFYHAMGNCNNSNVVYLKMNNTNKYTVNISWKEVFTTQWAKDKEGFAGTKTLLVKPGEIAEKNCAHPAIKQLLTLGGEVDPTYIADISKFDFKGIIVTKAN